MGVEIPRGLSREEWTAWYRYEYLASGHWAQMRKNALYWWENACGACGAKERLQIHHRSYERLGRERREDLMVLCRTCHEKRDRRRIARSLDQRVSNPDPLPYEEWVEELERASEPDPEDSHEWFAEQMSEWEDNLGWEAVVQER
jgi:5-methylcytosine-specific restriction endonuclease McrA